MELLIIRVFEFVEKVYFGIKIFVMATTLREIVNESAIAMIPGSSIISENSHTEGEKTGSSTITYYKEVTYSIDLDGKMGIDLLITQADGNIHIEFGQIYNVPSKVDRSTMYDILTLIDKAEGNLTARKADIFLYMR